MKISVFGAGYVGTVAAACLSRDGHDVIAVDPNAEKVAALNAGVSPLVEPGLEQLIQNAVLSGKLRGTSSPVQAIADSDLSFICVGTPARSDGALDTTYIARVAEEIGSQLALKASYHSIIVRSTTLPGTTESIVMPAIERASGKKSTEDFGIAYYPEFLREGSAIADYDNPGALVFGVADQAMAERLRIIHAHLAITPQTMSIRSAETVKCVNNAWHALKISFANEMGLISHALGVDSYDVMEALGSDRKLNISTEYLRPGFAFGGACLPKDVRALRFAARSVALDTPLIDGVLQANDNQLSRAADLVQRAGNRRVGIIGLSFKPETDDLRESPFVALAERLIKSGHEVKIYDPIVRLSRLTGANRTFIAEYLPQIENLLLEDIRDLLAHCETIVIGNPGEATTIAGDLLDGSKVVIDLARIDRAKRTAGQYRGICW